MTDTAAMLLEAEEPDSAERILDILRWHDPSSDTYTVRYSDDGDHSRLDDRTETSLPMRPTAGGCLKSPMCRRGPGSSTVGTGAGRLGYCSGGLAPVHLGQGERGEVDLGQ